MIHTKSFQSSSYNNRDKKATDPHGERITRSAERKLNSETFGISGNNRGYNRRGGFNKRGGRDFGGRGGRNQVSAFLVFFGISRTFGVSDYFQTKCSTLFKEEIIAVEAVTTRVTKATKETGDPDMIIELIIRTKEVILNRQPTLNSYSVIFDYNH